MASKIKLTNSYERKRLLRTCGHALDNSFYDRDLINHDFQILQYQQKKNKISREAIRQLFVRACFAGSVFFLIMSGLIIKPY